MFKRCKRLLILEPINKVLLHFAAADFAELVFGEFFEVVEGAWHFVAGEALAREVLEAFRIQCRAVAQGYARNDVFGTIFTWAAHHGGFFHIGVGEESFFNFGGVDVEATGNDDLFEAGDESDKAVFFHDSQVTGAEPAVMEGLLGGFRVVEVALKYLWAAGDDLAFFAIWHNLIWIIWIDDADLSIGERNSDVARPAAVGHGVADEDGGGFSQAESFHQSAMSELFPVFNGRYRKGSGA